MCSKVPPKTQVLYECIFQNYLAYSKLFGQKEWENSFGCRFSAPYEVGRGYKADTSEPS